MNTRTFHFRTNGVTRVALALSIALPLLVSCSEKQLRDRLEEEGYPPEYIDGYVDGCATGFARAGNPDYVFTRKLSEYRYDERYANGWDRGETECAKSQEGIQRVEGTLGSD